MGSVLNAGIEDRFSVIRWQFPVKTRTLGLWAECLKAKGLERRLRFCR